MSPFCTRIVPRSENDRNHDRFELCRINKLLRLRWWYRADSRRLHQCLVYFRYFTLEGEQFGVETTNPHSKIICHPNERTGVVVAKSKGPRWLLSFTLHTHTSHCLFVIPAGNLLLFFPSRDVAYAHQLFRPASSPRSSRCSSI